MKKLVRTYFIFLLLLLPLIGYSNPLEVSGNSPSWLSNCNPTQFTNHLKTIPQWNQIEKAVGQAPHVAYSSQWKMPGVTTANDPWRMSVTYSSTGSKKKSIQCSLKIQNNNGCVFSVYKDKPKVCTSS